MAVPAISESLALEVAWMLADFAHRLGQKVTADVEAVTRSIDSTLDLGKQAAEAGHRVDLVVAAISKARPDWLARSRFDALFRFHLYSRWFGEELAPLLQSERTDLRESFVEGFSSRLPSASVSQQRDNYYSQFRENGRVKGREDDEESENDDRASAGDEVLLGGEINPPGRESFVRVLDTLASTGLTKQHARYLLFRVIRGSLSMRLSHTYIARFQEVVSIINDLNTERKSFLEKDKHQLQHKGAIRPRISFKSIAARYLAIVARPTAGMPPDPNLWDCLIAVLAVGTMIGHVRVEEDYIRVMPPVLDAEYLISLSFGHSTNIGRFDDLFGGGGLLLADQISSGPRIPDALPGRVVLVRGENGCGKTMLALSLAAEIASKGGFCVFNALEYSSQVAQYVLARCGYGPFNSPFHVVCRSSEFLKICNDPPGEKGLLFIRDLEPSTEKPLDYTTLFKEIEKDVLPRAKRGIPGIVFVDSLNALTRMSHSQSGPIDVESERRSVLAALQRITTTGVNVLVTAEEDAGWAGFGEDIADTVIRLSSDGTDLLSGDRYLKRSHRGKYISVWKSRLQRELAGSHPFRIRSGKGLEVYLSTSSFAEIDKARGPAFAYSGLFGVVDLDMALSGSKNVNPTHGIERIVYQKDLKYDCGTVILLKGDLGTYKTQLGLSFVSWFSHDDYLARNSGGQGWELLPAARLRKLDKRVGLVISMRYSPGDIDAKLRQAICKETIEFMRDRSVLNDMAPKKIIWTCKLESGYVYPGEIFDQIESFFTKAHREGLVIDRVFLDNPGEWEDFCPLLKDDEIFGNTLITFLRRRRVKIVVSNRMINEGASGVIRAVSEAVETWIDLSHEATSTGDSEMALQVRRSPGMSHYRHKVKLSHENAEGVRLPRETGVDSSN